MPIIYDWPLIENCATRCILCGTSHQGLPRNRGGQMPWSSNCGDHYLIGTVDGKPLNCDFCGNCINACPTGTLMSKPFKLPRPSLDLST